jgi:hypothetical protein
MDEIGTGPLVGKPKTLKQLVIEFQESRHFRELPLSVRTRFIAILDWLPKREASWPLSEINASFARTLRDKAARERGWRFANYALLLLQSIVNSAICAGTLSIDRVRQVPKLLPPRLSPSSCRRSIRPVRRLIYSTENLSKRENSSA